MTVLSLLRRSRPARTAIRTLGHFLQTPLITVATSDTVTGVGRKRAKHTLEPGVATPRLHSNIQKVGWLWSDEHEYSLWKLWWHDCLDLCREIISVFNDSGLNQMANTRPLVVRCATRAIARCHALHDYHSGKIRRPIHVGQYSYPNFKWSLRTCSEHSWSLLNCPLRL